MSRDDYGHAQGGQGWPDDQYRDGGLESDDSDAFVRSNNGYVGDAETLLQTAIDKIAQAPTMPLSSSPRIDRDEIIELLEEALHRLPGEVRHARWMINERRVFVDKTRRAADEIMEAARVQAERMVQRTEVVRAAEARARQINEAATADARRMRHETEDFLDQRLASFENALAAVAKTVAAGRARLNIGVHNDEQQPVDPSQGFFDPEEL